MCVSKVLDDFNYKKRSEVSRRKSLLVIEDSKRSELHNAVLCDTFIHTHSSLRSSPNCSLIPLPAAILDLLLCLASGFPCWSVSFSEIVYNSVLEFSEV